MPHHLSTHSPHPGLLALLWTCRTPSHSDLFSSLTFWPQCSSPVYQQGALLTPLKFHCQRIFFWWPCPTLSPFIYLIFIFHHSTYWASHVTQVVKDLPANAGDARDAGSIPGLGISPGLWNGNPFQYSCLENFMARGAWQATVHGAPKSRTWLSTYTQHLSPLGIPYACFSFVWIPIIPPLESKLHKYWRVCVVRSCTPDA